MANTLCSQGNDSFIDLPEVCLCAPCKSLSLVVCEWIHSQIIQGMGHLKKMEKVGSQSGKTSRAVSIINCGEIGAGGGSCGFATGIGGTGAGSARRDSASSTDKPKVFFEIGIGGRSYLL